jgi:hypothetical protein
MEVCANSNGTLFFIDRNKIGDPVCVCIWPIVYLDLEWWRGGIDFGEQRKHQAKCQCNFKQWLGLTLEFWCMTRKTHPNILGRGICMLNFL